jgi:hypothetical protein
MNNVKPSTKVEAKKNSVDESKMNVKENGFVGQFYVLYNEWECEADKR